MKLHTILIAIVVAFVAGNPTPLDAAQKRNLLVQIIYDNSVTLLHADEAQQPKKAVTFHQKSQT